MQADHDFKVMKVELLESKLKVKELESKLT